MSTEKIYLQQETPSEKRNLYNKFFFNPLPIVWFPEHKKYTNNTDSKISPILRSNVPLFRHISGGDPPLSQKFQLKNKMQQKMTYVT